MQELGRPIHSLAARERKATCFVMNRILLLLDFSVNDESTEHFLETYEGVIRKLYYAEKKPAVMLLHNVYYHDGSNAQLQHAKIARHYDIPAVSMQSSIYPELLAGKNRKPCDHTG